ncbi:protransforming growth factor alpha-like [Discoglossus pictus]
MALPICRCHILESRLRSIILADTMLGSLVFVLAASFVADSSLFAECPEAYTNFCYHGTCRFLVTEWEATCRCNKGYIGNRCQYLDLLQVISGDPRSFTVVALSVTFLVVLSLIGNTCLGIYLCRIKREKKTAGPSGQHGCSRSLIVARPSRKSF